MSERDSEGVVDPSSVAARPNSPSRGPGFKLGLVIGSLVSIAVVLLVVQNGESARLDWLAFHFTAPLWSMLAITTLAGAVMGQFARLLWQRRRANRRARAEATPDTGASTD